jgi:hypothetical protein
MLASFNLKAIAVCLEPLLQEMDLVLRLLKMLLVESVQLGIAPLLGGQLQHLFRLRLYRPGVSHVTYEERVDIVATDRREGYFGGLIEQCFEASCHLVLVVPAGPVECPEIVPASLLLPSH